MKWHEAVKIWNSHQFKINAKHVYAMPRRGTPEHAEVKKIQGGEKPMKKFAYKKKDESEEVLREIDEFLNQDKKKSIVRRFLKGVMERKKRGDLFLKDEFSDL